MGSEDEKAFCAIWMPLDLELVLWFTFLCTCYQDRNSSIGKRREPISRNKVR